MKTGLKVLAVRVTKPKIPASIQKNYELMEAEKTKLLISTQRQKVIEKEAVIEAEKEASVAKIQYERKISEKQSLKQMAKIEDEMHLDKEKSRTDAEYYRIKRDSEANALLLTKEYLELRKYA